MNNKKRKFDAELIIADSERDANMLYATGFSVPDPFIFFNTSKGSAVVMSDLEYGRALKQAKVDKVHSLSRLKSKTKKQGKTKTPSHDLIDILSCYFKKEGVASILVPENFPIRFADSLRKKRFKLHYKEDPFFEERAAKKKWEVESIKKAIRVTEKGFAAALKILQDSSIGDDRKLYYHGKILKAEDIRGEINSTITAMGFSISHTIVSHGNQTCDPHNEGSGPLRADQTIIMDIFPRSDKTGYYADFTRTVVKGKATDQVRKAYRMVREAQTIAFDMIADGVDGKDVHLAIIDHFRKNGFPNKERKGVKEGFIHGTGHGLGLALHEYPRINGNSCVLKTGNVVTVEPGLYYRGMGGIRLEDVVVVTKNGCKNLTRFPKVLEI